MFEAVSWEMSVSVMEWEYADINREGTVRITSIRITETTSFK